MDRASIERISLDVMAAHGCLATPEPGLLRGHRRFGTQKPPGHLALWRHQSLTLRGTVEWESA